MHARPTTIARRCSRARPPRCRQPRTARPVFHPLPHTSPTGPRAGNAGLIVLAADVPVQDAVNPYFHQLCEYHPWNGEYMRWYTGHEDHFHIRVKKPDGLCH
jgi:hypothetical protein